jgi:ankyrin repeat protein
MADVALFAGLCAFQSFYKSHFGTKKDKDKEQAATVSLLDPALVGDLDKIKTALLVASESSSTSSSSSSLAGDHDDNHLVALINHQDAQGNAAMHGAVFGGHLNVVKYLYENGASLELQNSLGCSQLWLAAGYNHEEVLDFLVQHLDKKALLTANGTGDSPLLAAASKGHVDITKKLVEYGKQQSVLKEMICATNNSQDSALSVAIGAGIGNDVFDLLCDKDILNLANAKGLTPLLLASERDFPDVFTKLVDADADVHVKDANGDSVLAVAAFCGSSSVVRLLLANHKHLMNVAASKSGCTPLWLSVRAGHLDCTRLLLVAGADRSIANSEGLTPMQAATKYKRDNMVELLSQHD